MSDTPRAQMRLKQLYDEACENPADFAEKVQNLEHELEGWQIAHAAERARVAVLENDLAAARAEAADYKDAARRLDDMYCHAVQELDKARAEAEALRADAERYRWLSDESCGDPIWQRLADEGMTGNEFDAAIDAARERK